MNRTAKLAPSIERFRPQEELLQELEFELENKFSLKMLPPYSLIVEGWTDVSYIQLAARLHLESTGVDLLEVSDQIAGRGGVRIEAITPGKANDPTRGGVPQMVRLAELLKPYAFMLGAFNGLLYLFDHDKAGREGADEVEKHGYKRGVNILTLNPKEHPGTCAEKDVCIEDLLSLGIQERFFEMGGASCTVEYRDGVLKRFQWHHDSKASLRDFVAANGNTEDLKEILRLIGRVRGCFGIP